MKLCLYYFKREIGGTIENPKTKIHFVIVDSETSKDYPLNFVCVLPQMHGLVNGNSTFGKIFGDESIPLARRLLSSALRQERDLEIKVEVEKRLKMFNQKNNCIPRYCNRTKNGVEWNEKTNYPGNRFYS
jgi:hypothetical protein